MINDLFVRKGLSLERLDAFLKVAQTSSITAAAEGDPIRQSQYSRQIKELEQFFNIALVEKRGRGIALTDAGHELSRVSRYFLLALSKLAQGYAKEAPNYNFGGLPELIHKHIIHRIAKLSKSQNDFRFSTVAVAPDSAISRIWDLSLDFAIIPQQVLPRQLDSQVLCTEPYLLCSRYHQDTIACAERFQTQLKAIRPEANIITCSHIDEVFALVVQGTTAGLLPQSYAQNFDTSITPIQSTIEETVLLVWNRRLLRLDPKAQGVIRNMVT